MAYREVLRPPWWTYGVVIGLLALLCFTFAAAATVPAALVVFGVLVVVGVYLVSRRRLQISVDDTSLRVGSQTLPLTEVSAATALDAEALLAAAGPQADPRAHLMLRNLATKQGVKIELSEGPVPYWLISSEHPQELAEALSGPSAVD